MFLDAIDRLRRSLSSLHDLLHLELPPFAAPPPHSTSPATNSIASSAESQKLGYPVLRSSGTRVARKSAGRKPWRGEGWRAFGCRRRRALWQMRVQRSLTKLTSF